MSLQVARLGDAIGHDAIEGVIITASVDNFGDGTPGRARVGDLVYCTHSDDDGPVHGVQHIITGSPDVFVDNARAARIGDMISCGATIIVASTDLRID